MDQIITFKNPNLDQIITFKNPKLGPDNNFAAYIYIYISMPKWPRGALPLSARMRYYRAIPSPQMLRLTSPERNCGDKFLWLRRKSGRRIGRRIGRNFLRIFVLHLVYRMTHKSSPKIPPIYLSMSCGWNFEFSSPRASGVWRPQQMGHALPPLHGS